MSYISKLADKYAQEKKEYSISELEKSIADIIVNQAECYIEGAIKQGYSTVSMEYYNDTDGGINIQPIARTIEYYLYNDWSKYLYSLSDLISVLDKDNLNLRNAIFNNEKKLNLSNIENYIQKGMINLGAKKATVYVRFSEYVFVDVEKKGLFGKRYIIEEKRLLNKYKICYTVSW